VIAYANYIIINLPYWHPIDSSKVSSRLIAVPEIASEFILQKVVHSAVISSNRKGRPNYSVIDIILVALPSNALRGRNLRCKLWLLPAADK
jgi:hypothetical protein